MAITFTGGQSYYRPFSFDELLKPLALYKEERDSQLDSYDNLVEQAKAWEDIANREKSPEAYEMYRRFNAELEGLADTINSGRLDRVGLSRMKGRYAQEIQPIANAHAAMKEANDLRDKLGSDAIFEVGRYGSIDSFLHGQTANNRYESRKDIVARTAALTQATAQSILNDPIIRNSMNPQFLEVIQRQGIGSLDELQQAIAGSPEALNRFAQIKNTMISQLGGLDRFDLEGRAAVEGAINEGLYSGLDNYQVALQKNGEYVDKASRISNSIAQQNATTSRLRLDWEQTKYDEAQKELRGEKATAVGSDGTEYFDNGIETWKITPDGKRVGLGPSTRGKKETKTPTEKPEKPEKLGRTVGLTYDLEGGNPKPYDNKKQEPLVTEDPETLYDVGGYENLTTREQQDVELKYREVRGNHNGFNYYYVYYDKNGEETTPDATGKHSPVQRKVIIRDK